MRIMIKQLRQRIMGRLRLAKKPDPFPKTILMKYLEMKYQVKMEDVVFGGSLSQVVKLFGDEIDPSTVSLWRKFIREEEWR